MSPNPLDPIWRAADVDSPVFTGDEVAVWPPGTMKTLQNLELVGQAKTAAYVTCDACAGEHVGEVIPVSGPSALVRFYLACPEHGRVELDGERLRQWSVRFDRLCRILAEKLGIRTEPEEVVPGRLWKLGLVAIAGRSRAVWVGRGLSWPDAGAFAGALPTGKSPLMFLLGRRPREGVIRLDPDSLVELAQVISVLDDRIILDGTAVEQQLVATGSGTKRKPAKKRAPRAAAIDSLEKALIQHITGARDQAHAARARGRPPTLLPRPRQLDLAAEVGLTRAAVSRAFNDENAHKLRLLWELADDLDRVMGFSGR